MADIRYARPVLDDMVKRSEELISTRIRIRESLSSAESIFKASKELELRMRALSEENQTRHNELAICIEHLTKHVSEGVRTSIGVLNETLDREGQTLPEAPAVIEVRNQLVDILGGTHSGVSERELDRLEAKYRSHGVLLKQLVGYQAQCLDATLPPVHAEHSRIVTAGGGGEVMPLKGGMLIPMFWNVRRLLPDEVRRVDEIELQNFPWERFTEEINETESQLEVRTWGVVSNGRVVGYVRWRWANEGSQIERIYVEEDFRRRGIGKAMCESVLKHSGSPPSLTLMTREGDKEVREFLEKTGFRAIGISREAFIDPAEDGFVWRSVARPW
jgi:ribosomal protein S18 acetylase RimI-like enzyme